MSGGKYRIHPFNISFSSLLIDTPEILILRDFYCHDIHKDLPEDTADFFKAF
jgi:hypothetical protein